MNTVSFLYGVYMNTIFLLMAQYDAQIVIPLRRVCADYFVHLTPEKLRRKVEAGEIDLALIRLDDTDRASLAVHLMDLAAYIDAQRLKAHVIKKQPQMAPTDRPVASLVDLVPTRAPAWDGASSDLIRLPEVMRITGLCKAGIYKMMKNDNFPSQVKLGDRAVAWVRGEVSEWCRRRIESSRLLGSQQTLL